MGFEILALYRRAARVVLGAIVASALLVLTDAAAAQTVPSEGASSSAAITVEGNRRIEADTIRSYFHPGPGGHLDAAGVDAALKALIATGLFQDVRIGHAGGHLVVTVVENPLIRRLAFEGNNKVKEEQLSKEVQSKAGGTLSRATVQADVIRITDIHRRSGRFNVRVEPKIIELPNQRVDLVFEIQDGERTGIKDIVFVGNKAYPSNRLRQLIKSGVTNILSGFLDNDVYDPDRVEADRDLLRRFYLKHGYSDVRVTSAAATYDPARKGFIVTFSIDEGPLYRVGTVDVQSDLRVVDPAVLRQKVRTATGDVMNIEAMEKSVEEVSIELAKNGYPFAVVRPRVDRRQGNVINLVYRVEQGARAYVERINIRGNTKTNDNVIRREFEMSEGDPYNRALVDRAERRLKNLGYFKTVKITNEPGSAPDRVIVNVNVEDQATGDFSVAGGYGTSDGWMGQVSVSERNFLGAGYYVKTAVQYGQYTKGFEFAFTEPYFLGYRVAAGIDVFAKQATSSTYQSYGSERYGATLTMGAPLTDDLSMQGRYSLYRQRVTLDPTLMDCSPSNPPPGCYANGEASIPIKQAVLNGPSWVSAIGYTMAYNTLDNPRNPTSGIRSEFRQDLAGLGGDVKFLRSTEDLRYYHEITNDVVGVARVQYGTISPWGGQALPLMNSFFGGPDLVRGFAPNGIGPRDITPGTTMDNVGGTRYWATSVEVQTPVPMLPPESGLKVAAFSDAGSLWGFAGAGGSPSLSQSLQVADSKAVRSSIGAGLLWDSPLGPLRVDYAYPITKATYDKTQRFRFSAWGF